MSQIDSFKIKQKIKDAIFSRLSSVSGVLSITLVGSFIDSDNLAGISDIDTIVVCEKLNDVIFKQCTEQIKSTDISSMDEDELNGILDKIIQKNMELVKKLGDNAVTTMMGIAMKEVRGKASGKVVNDLLRKKISEL